MRIVNFLPKVITNKLFGEREKYGSIPFPDDKDWQEWLTFYYGFYSATQKKGISSVVNHSGYRILSKISLENKKVLEIGPGDLPHQKFWVGKPSKYFLCDIREEFLRQSQQKLRDYQVETETCLVNSPSFPIPDSEVDFVIAFYVLEHLAPFEEYLSEILRILKPGGLLIAGIPTEGGLLWGLGRYFSSRRYIKAHSNLNPDKIICWEHPNMAHTILERLESRMGIRYKRYWPFILPIIDLNLIIRFIYQKHS